MLTQKDIKGAVRVHFSFSLLVVGFLLLGGMSDKEICARILQLPCKPFDVNVLGLSFYAKDLYCGDR